MAVDESMRPLKIPPKFVSYLEKHRIYELFYDLGQTIAIHQPVDHILFLKSILAQSTKAIIHKIIIIAPPHVDKERLAEYISFETGALVISSDYIQKCYENSTQAIDFSSNSPDVIAERILKIFQGGEFLRNGWILFDYPRTLQQAEALQQVGILPTHTLQLIPSITKYSPKDIWNENIKAWTYEKFLPMMQEYKRHVVGLRKAYHMTLQEIVIRGRTMEQIAFDCHSVIMKKVKPGAPMLPRVVIVGIRGSNRRVLAKRLAQRFNLVHVDLASIVARASVAHTLLGDRVQALKKAGCPIYKEICTRLLEERLMEEDCLNHGWVLTNYPNDVTEFMSLDNFDTPPNRTVFLIAQKTECLNRLKDRKVNMYTGELHSLKEVKCLGDTKLEMKLKTHPDDDLRLVIHTQEIQSEELLGMLEYCNNNCSVLDGQLPLQTVYEHIECVVMEPTPSVSPRLKLSSLYTFKESLLDQQSDFSSQHTNNAFSASNSLFYSRVSKRPSKDKSSELTKITEEYQDEKISRILSQQEEHVFKSKNESANSPLVASHKSEISHESSEKEEYELTESDLFGSSFLAEPMIDSKSFHV